VRCAECGFETNKQKRHIEQAKACRHIGRSGGYINYDASWSDDKLRRIFSDMKARCYDKSNKSYRWYGAKGVKVCDDWMRNPELFESWSLTNGYDDGLTIDRIDWDGDYSPDNCRWVTLADNSKYKSTTSLIDVDGTIHTGKDWAKTLGLGVNRINTYVRNYGLDNTVEFIKRRLKNPDLKPRRKQSYYDLYMN
jgi:hypothetical protein